ncbi:putative outer membrane protein probably involved in nutrient binding protein [Lunatimonas lonarensis]|uniref:Putative outer membrane protein probably involved in nutrient binding protein n=1 Tax=Lunatimonas lonarensis TaxID=1232681 RepID=R7ZKR7_9BACT|nr:RagB/SusD family nutrient uptake outer membrane protein [Lunatimonas lonarensis]EON74688.1 putative outer membrane protein probably involved in nutrient binding protein [Lunatimonas lonarensis]
MKSIKYIVLGLVSLLFGACAELDLAPKTAISSENFFRNEAELQIGLNSLYQINLWKIDLDYWTDDEHHRGAGPAINDISTANLNSESGLSGAYWRDLYDGVKRANTLLEEMEQVKSTINPAVYDRIEGEARAIRAYFYGILMTKFGDVPLITSRLPLNEALTIIRTDKQTVKSFVYSELDAAAAKLPANTENRVSKGFALGIKARFALYEGDFAIARDAAKAVIDLGIYSLDPDFRNLFLRSGSNSPELIYFVPMSVEFGVNFGNTPTRDYIPRNAGGFGAALPTFEALHVFECSDGLTVSESPLYNPHRPFENRDPRLTQTIVEFGTPWLGYVLQPHPDSLRTMSVATGQMITNNDTRGVAIFASFTGMLWKKGIEQRWADAPRLADPNLIILRYADVLLMYAESLIELNENLTEARNAINRVRARAYGVSVDQISLYPALTENDQNSLRIRLRRERRVELMREGLRYQDVIRWRVAKKALDRIVLGLPQPIDQDRNQWPFNNIILPIIDNDGVVDMRADELISRNFARQLQDYDFDEDRMYLWPIPATDRLLNNQLTQNPNY